jgi:preprotein translocase subunit SecG
MWDFSISRALGLMVRTAPFILLRILVYFAISAALVLMTGAGAGIGYSFGQMGEDEARATSTFWGGTAGFALTAGVIFFLRDYILYLVKAGHIAVMVELLDGRQVPGGRGQIAYARAVVTERFGQASALFALDQLIKGVVTLVTGLMQGMMSLVPIPGLDWLMGLVRAYLRLAVGLVDEVILGHAIRSRSDNAWEAAHDGLVLYAQNAKPMLGAAAWLTLITWVMSALIFLLMLGPAAAVAALLPGDGSAGLFVFAILFAWAVKAALIEPFALACLLQVFFAETSDQSPSAEWRGRLTHLSEKFRKLGEQAVSGGLHPTRRSDLE